MNERYAIATVVGRTPPVSSHVGDRAIVRADGRMEGFVGGSCSRDIIRRQALAAMRAGEPRLVHIRPDAREIIEEGGGVTIPMRCTSEGAVDVYIEPFVPKPRLIVAGFTPVADALATIGSILGFTVSRFAAGEELRDTDALDVEALTAYLDATDREILARSAAVVASQGHYDEEALEAILRYDLAYTGLLASHKRGAAALNALIARGVSAQRVSRVRTPAGIDIGATRAGDVAVSIFAQIIAQRAEQHAEASDTEARTSIAVDPVCGMEVDVEHALHRATIEDRAYYFCSAACHAEFVANASRSYS